jgi:post-segregation antitoxin (ccd killing protein)
MSAYSHEDKLQDLSEAKVVSSLRDCEGGLAQEIAATRKERWLEENGTALDAANAYVKARGLPLACHRKF